MVKLNKPVLLARIGAAHGIKGEVRIKSFTSDPLALGDYGTLYDANGNNIKILSLRPQKDMLVARLAGIDSREKAEGLNGKEIFVERDQLPADLEEDEFYLEDLIGLAVHDLDNTPIGKVRSLYNFGAGDLIEMSDKTGKLVFIPFTQAAIPTIDIAGGKIIIDPVLAGLVSEKEDEFTDAELAEAQKLANSSLVKN
ncbi:ribosome maturation factor RimM [Bartonella sp. HY761]|uniref:ribosome maturation factor RimM n=1 Tax=Bartonella sp. HY761 TaxID=2979330 RepID=UPI0021FFFC71|nr:ribosome maturation factor RimM [Bartonella sp. HY761]UXN06529.1 ribosome maturation factor RimM [Bartonella sp. HY761]